MITVWAPYPGNVISLNHMYYPNSKRMRPEAVLWQAKLTQIIRVRKNYLGIELTPPINIRLTGRWKDHRWACDYDNLHKIIGDAIKAAIEIDDEHLRWHDAEPVFGVDLQDIVIDIWGEGDEATEEERIR